MDLSNYMLVGSLAARLLDSCLRYEVKSNRNEAKNVKLTKECSEI
jgi:hypothetical protein